MMLTLNLPNEQVHKLSKELVAAGRREIGGILMGEQLQPGNFRVTEMTFQRNGGMVARFVRNAQFGLAVLHDFFTLTEHCYERFNYLGEWHSHPSFELYPSRTDHESMRDIICRQDTGANFVLLLITKLNSEKLLEGNLTVYLPDGTVEEGVLNISISTDHP